ncbi:uncharacterized protein METZ01_LOCUS166113 [marine metagenome]|uniref:Uncharacterized protein n=1 Tax=marine metagenome TaxID=408172 RepID=A0A382BI15_9ZZZZ
MIARNINILDLHGSMTVIPLYKHWNKKNTGYYLAPVKID